MKYLFFILSIAISISAHSSNYQGSIDRCRIHANGDLSIYVDSTNFENQNQCAGAGVIAFAASNGLSTVHINRFVAACLTAQSADKDIRVDYLTCSNGIWRTTGNSSLQTL